jgi:hypothetical protein
MYHALQVAICILSTHFSEHHLSSKTQKKIDEFYSRAVCHQERFMIVPVIAPNYRTGTIISCSRYEATLVYKLRMLSFKKVSCNTSQPAA